MDASTIVVKCHALPMAASVLNARALITQVRREHLLRLDTDDIIYNTQDTQYDHDALKEMVMGFQTRLGLTSEVLDHSLLQKLLRMPAGLDLVRLPTEGATFPEECDNDDEQVFTDLMAERNAAAQPQALLQ